MQTTIRSGLYQKELNSATKKLNSMDIKFSFGRFEFDIDMNFFTVCILCSFEFPPKVGKVFAHDLRWIFCTDLQECYPLQLSRRSIVISKPCLHRRKKCIITRRQSLCSLCRHYKWFNVISSEDGMGIR